MEYKDLGSEVKNWTWFLGHTAKHNFVKPVVD